MYKYTLNYTEQMYAATGATLPCFTVTLKHDIVASMLDKAVNAALAYHPHFKTRLVRQNGLFALEENPKPPVIKECDWDGEVVYGNDEFNNYPWAIVYTGKKISFSAIHALTDGGGTLGFLFAVLRQYMELRGKMFTTPIGHVADESISRTMEDMFQVNGNPAIKGFPKPKFGDPMDVPAEFYETDPSKVSVYRVSVELPDIKKYSIESQTSNFTVVAYIIAKAMERAIGKKEGVIKLRVPVSMRGLFKSVSDRKSIIIPQLNYDIKRMGNMNRNLVETAFKGQLFLFSDKDNAIEGCNEMNAATQALLEHPETLEAQAKAFDEGCNAMKAGISYSQATNAHSFGEMEQYMENYEVYHFADCMRYMEIIGNTFNNKINLSVSQSSKGDILVEKIREVLEEEKIHYEIEKVHTHGRMQPAKEMFK